MSSNLEDTPNGPKEEGQSAASQAAVDPESTGDPQPESKQQGSADSGQAGAEQQDKHETAVQKKEDDWLDCGSVKESAESPEDGEGKGRRVIAVLHVHGMGEQERYGPMASAAEEITQLMTERAYAHPCSPSGVVIPCSDDFRDVHSSKLHDAFLRSEEAAGNASLPVDERRCNCTKTQMEGQKLPVPGPPTGRGSLEKGAAWVPDGALHAWNQIKPEGSDIRFYRIEGTVYKKQVLLFGHPRAEKDIEFHIMETYWAPEATGIGFWSTFAWMNKACLALLKYLGFFGRFVTAAAENGVRPPAFNWRYEGATKILKLILTMYVLIIGAMLFFSIGVVNTYVFSQNITKIDFEEPKDKKQRAVCKLGGDESEADKASAVTGNSNNASSVTDDPAVEAEAAGDADLTEAESQEEQDFFNVSPTVRENQLLYRLLQDLLPAKKAADEPELETGRQQARVQMQPLPSATQTPGLKPQQGLNLKGVVFGPPLKAVDEAVPVPAAQGSKEEKCCHQHDCEKKKERKELKLDDICDLLFQAILLIGLGLGLSVMLNLLKSPLPERPLVPQGPGWLRFMKVVAWLLIGLDLLWHLQIWELWWFGCTGQRIPAYTEFLKEFGWLRTMAEVWTQCGTGAGEYRFIPMALEYEAWECLTRITFAASFTIVTAFIHLSFWLKVWNLLNRQHDLVYIARLMFFFSNLSLICLYCFFAGMLSVLSAYLLYIVLYVTAWRSLNFWLSRWFGDVAIFTNQNENSPLYRRRQAIVQCMLHQLDYLFATNTTVSKDELWTGEKAVETQESGAKQKDVEGSDQKYEGYPEVIIYAHSLGCIVSYCGICEYFRRLFQRGDGKEFVSVRERFTAFLTTGCHLDIVEYLFDPGASDAKFFDPLRLAGRFAVPAPQDCGQQANNWQPFLKLYWVNIWNWWDVFSSKLFQYGWVVNSRIALYPPLLCHSYYMKNKRARGIFKHVLLRKKPDPLAEPEDEFRPPSRI